MTDIIYSVGPDSGHGNRELAWSLASLKRYAKNLGRVVVAGYPPDWLPDWAERFPFERIPDHSNYYNLFECVMAAIDAGAVCGEFLYSSDDHFLSMPFDCDAVPFWRRQSNPVIRSLPEARAAGRPCNNFDKMMAQTREVLLANGYGIVRCNVHKMTRIRCDEAVEARRLADSAPDKYFGVELTCVFQNIRARKENIVWTWDPKDWKLYQFDPEAVASGQFSCADAAFADRRFLEYMDMTYGDCCRAAPEAASGA